MQEMQVQSLGWEDPQRKKWQPTPIFLPGKSHGQRSLVGCSPWGHKELDTTERVNNNKSHYTTLQQKPGKFSTCVQLHLKEKLYQTKLEDPTSISSYPRLVCMGAQWLSHVQLFATPWTAAHQAPLSMGFPREEYWSGLP